MVEAVGGNHWVNNDVGAAHIFFNNSRAILERTDPILAAVDLLKRNPEPTENDIRNGLAGNLCRCTGYMKIFESVVRAYQK